MDQDTWRFVNTFAPWASACATFSAVVVSLRLAKRASTLDLRVSQAIVEMGTPGVPESWEEFFQVRVINHRGDAVVKGITWKVLGSRKQWVVLPPNDPYSTRLPAKLSIGDEAMLLFPTASFNEQAKSILEFIAASPYPQLRVRRFRIGIIASTGETFWTGPDKRLRTFLVEESKKAADALA